MLNSLNNTPNAKPVDASAIRITQKNDTAAPIIKAPDTDLPKKGGEGGVPAVSNAEFLGVLFPKLHHDELVAVCGKPGNPEEGGWHPSLASELGSRCPSDRNNYFNCSTFNLTEDGTLLAKTENFYRYQVLVFDDVGTKVPLEKVAHVEPTYGIETSPGNFQYGYVLATPISDVSAMTLLQNACADAGLTDNGAKGAARWMRLPNAINGKPKYHDDGKAFRCRLTKWNPDKRFSEEQLFADFKLAPPSPPSPALITAAGTRAASSAVVNTGISHQVFTPASAVNPIISSLKVSNLYKQDQGHGRHAITCPWVDEHTDQLDDGSAYFEPSEAFPMGGFKCHHGHCTDRSIGDLLTRFEIDEDVAQHRPIIHIIPGTSDQSVLAAEHTLASTGDVFQMGGAIVLLQGANKDGDVTIDWVKPATLMLRLSSSTIWKRRNRQGWQRCNPPTDQVKMLLETSRYRYLPVLTGISRQPYYRPTDETLVTQPGFDERSGIYGAFEGFDICPTDATADDARQALRELEGLLSEFRFETEGDKAVALSAMMTATVRPSLPFAPAFLFVAPDSGVGKSYLNKLINCFAGGKSKLVAFPGSKDEATKLTLTLLMSAPAAIEYDNMTSGFLPHPTLLTMLTEESLEGRILGVSKSADVSTRCFVTGSGNNVRPVGDMQRRVLTSNLAARDEEGIGRKFVGRPVDYARKNREKLVGCVFTIIEAWKNAGSPKTGVPDIATYNGEWSDYCRHPLIWLGLQDPAACVFEQVSNDPERVLVGKFLVEWLNVFGNSAIPSRRVTEHAYDKPHSLLTELLQDFPVYDGSAINRSKFGRYLTRQAGKIIGGLRLTKCDADGRNGYRVEKVVKVVTPPSPPLPVPTDEPIQP